MKTIKLIKLYLFLAQIILCFSAVMDFAFYFMFNLHIPSWTIAVFSIMVVILIEIVKRSVFP